MSMPRPLPFACAAVSAIGLAAALAGTAAAADPPVVVAFKAPSAVESGKRVAVSGRVAPAGRTTVVVQRLGGGGSWKAMATLRSDRRGRFAAKLPLNRSANLRAIARAGAGNTGQPSRRRAVAVRRTAEVRVVTDAGERIIGKGLSVRGRVAPARPGETLRVLGRHKGRTVKLATTRAGQGGHVATTLKLPWAGSWRIVLEAPGRQGFDVTGSGASAPMLAYAANPHGVPSSSSRYIVQDLSERLLYYYEDGGLRRIFPVVFGKPSTPTPLGTYRVYSKTAGPRAAFGPLVLWYHRGYGIHGTNQPELLTHEQRYYSLGCTRNTNDNIRWLWPRVPVGTPVRNIA